MNARLLLVHGAFHGAWCWDRVVPVLTARGIESEAVELPFTSLVDDADTVARAIERTPGPVVVVGHSYGGAVITAGAGGRDGRRSADHLVYLTAMMPDPDHPVDMTPTPGMKAIGRGEDGLSFIDPDQAVAGFYHRAPAADAEWALSQLRKMPFSTLAQSAKPDQVAWRHVPSTYVVCTEDQVLFADDQRQLATRADRSIELDSDHSPFFCQVGELADILAETAQAVRNT